MPSRKIVLTRVVAQVRERQHSDRWTVEFRNRRVLGKRRLRLARKSVADTRHRHDQLRVLRIPLDLPAQPPDKDIDTAVKRLRLTTHHCLHQVIARKRPPRTADKCRKQIELGRRERNIGAGCIRKAVRTKVEHQPGETEPVRHVD
jgi:hypothetical protein